MAVKVPKGYRDCPALGCFISSADCGQKRNSELLCPATCAFSPFAPPGYDLWLRLDGTWMPKAVKWIVSNVGAEEFRQTVEDYCPDGAADETIDFDLAFPVAVHWYLGWYRGADGQTLGERWKKAGWPGLNNDERVMSEYRCRSVPTLLEIQRITDPQSVWVRDIWAEPRAEPFLIVDRTAARDFRTFDLIVSWITRYPHFGRFVGAAFKVPRMIREGFESEWLAFVQEELDLEHKPNTDEMRQVLASDFDYAFDLLRDLERESSEAMLRGVNAQICRAFYRIIGSRKQILAQLGELPEFEPAEAPSEDDLPDCDAFTWLRRGESKRIEAEMPEPFRHHDDESAGVGVLGRLSVGADEVMVQTMSAQKNDFARLRLQEVFGPQLRFERESRVDAAVQIADRLKDLRENDEYGINPDGPAGHPQGTAPEIPTEMKVKLIRMAMERHFDRLADAKLPLFGGRSPREAARDPVLRQAVISWVKDQWLNAIELGQRDGADLADLPRKLAMELGLDELRDF